MNQQWIKKVTLTELQQTRSLRDQLIAWRIPRRIQGQLRQGRRVFVNGSYKPMNTNLEAGDELTMLFMDTDFTTPVSSYVPDASQAVDVLFENEDLLVVNKSAGVKMHPNSPGETGTLMNYVQAYLGNDDLADAYMVHRLDEDTSGAVLIAKTPIVVSVLNAYLKDKVIQRSYLAIVEGVMDQIRGEVDLPIGVNPDNERLRQVNGRKAQEALTHWKVIQSFDNHALVALQLDTGRTHQIRVHMQALGHPIVGDQYYNLKQSHSRLMLHANKITFILPFANEQKEVKADLPTDFCLN